MGDEDRVRADAKEACQVSMASSKALTAGGSLPPRKRLLVGLKQNGWSISSAASPSPSCSSSNPSVAAHGAAPVALKEDNNSREGLCEVSEEQNGCKQVEPGCMRCGVRENSVWRRLKKGGASQRFCNSCVLLYGANSYCPHCLGLYQDSKTLGDPSVWLVCCRCQRSVHAECEAESGKTKDPDPFSYLCPNCYTHKAQGNGTFDSVAKPLAEDKAQVLDRSQSKEGSSAESPSENLKSRSHSYKKPRRVGRDSRTNSCAGKLSVNREGLGLGQISSALTSKVSGGSPVSVQEAAVVAKAAAASLAAKAAAAAKATAYAKACVAAKAAVAARAALEAAALAARAEIRAREELASRSVFIEMQVHAAKTEMHVNIDSEVEMDNIANVENPCDDEELARQLHRVMNSSPRITRSAPPTSKREAKSEADGELKVPVHPSSCFPDDPLPFPKPQLTRPRSVIHKDKKRWEPKASILDIPNSECTSVKGSPKQFISQTSLENGVSSRIHQEGGPFPLPCNERTDSGMAMVDKQIKEASLNTLTSDKNGASDTANLKLESLAVCKKSKKIFHNANGLTEIASHEGVKVPLGDSLGKNFGVAELCTDAHVKMEDRKLASPRVFCTGSRLEFQSPVSQDQSPPNDGKVEGRGLWHQKPSKSFDKQKTQHWKSVSTLLSSEDCNRTILNTKTFPSNQRSDESNEGKSTKIVQNGVKNGENFGIRSKFKPFSRGLLGNQHPKFHPKLKERNLDVKQSLLKHKASQSNEAVPVVGNSFKGAKTRRDDTKSQRVDVSKGNRLGSGPASASASMASLACSSMAHLS